MDIDQLVGFLQAHDLRIVTAESCTAGLIASTVADVEGAGELLDCAFVTYSPQAKQKCLGVRAEITGSSAFEELPAVMPKLADGEIPALCHRIDYGPEKDGHSHVSE